MNKILLSVIFILLVSCQTGHMQVKNHKQSKKGQVTNRMPSQSDTKQRCIIKCEQLYKSCLSQCHDSCKKCQKEADKQAWKNYQAYYKKMKIQGTYRPRDWLSFRDPLQCRKVTCSCIGDLNVCIQQCGGKVSKKLRKTPYCQ